MKNEAAVSKGIVVVMVSREANRLGRHRFHLPMEREISSGGLLTHVNSFRRLQFDEVLCG